MTSSTKRWMMGTALLLSTFVVPSGAQAQLTAAEIAKLKSLLPFIQVIPGSLNGVKGPHIVITGANLHLRSGSGDTDDNGVLTGRGNLIIGYDVNPAGVTNPAPNRVGSHNLVVGDRHSFLGFGGIVGGLNNTIDGQYTSVTAGTLNRAEGLYTHVGGGTRNLAGGDITAILGGTSNTALGIQATVCGGFTNLSDGVHTVISGGAFKYCGWRKCIHYWWAT